jgi:plastocyanin
MPFCLTRCLLTALVALVPLLSAAQPGTVEGTIAFEAAKPAPMMAQYRARTRVPIAEPDAPRAIVYLEREDGAYPAASAETVVAVDQRGYQFRPAMVAVQRGTQVSFPNRDDEFHSVFSYSPAKRFDLGRFRRDEDSPLIEFDQAGLVKVYCEIHKHMRGFVLVLETPWFTTTAADGRYRLADVPPGDYLMHVLLPSEQTLTTSVTVSAGQTSRVDLEQ